MSPEALARHIVATLRQAGHQAWLVGGCVRDLLLGAEPKDFDVSTDARPERLAGAVPGPGAWGRTSAWCWCAATAPRWK